MERTNTTALPTARTVERALAALLVGLLGAYALGTVAEGTAPALRTVGVVSVHLAVVVAALFPVAVLAHALVGRARGSENVPALLEIGIALVTIGCFAAVLLAEMTPAAGRFTTTLLGTGVGGLLVLAGLVAGCR